MSGLAWVRLDTGFPRNQKIVTLISRNQHRAAFLYVCGLTYAGEQGTDGWIPEPMLPMLHGRKTDANQLVDVGLWIPRPGGWDINDWCEYQPSSDETSARSARARAAAHTRWHGQPDAPRNAQRNATRMPNA